MDGGGYFNYIDYRGITESLDSLDADIVECVISYLIFEVSITQSFGVAAFLHFTSTGVKISPCIICLIHYFYQLGNFKFVYICSSQNCFSILL